MMSFAVLSIVKATLICGVAFFLSRLCRRARASIRHLLFVLAFTALVVVPVAGPMLPTVTVTVPATPPVPAPGTQEMAAGVPSSAAAQPAGSNTPSVSRETAAGGSVTIVQVIAAAWLTGVALFLVPVVVGFCQVRRLRRVALPWRDGQALVKALAPTLGVHRWINVLLHDAVTGPLTCGVLKPAIILPASAQRWDETALSCALRHELEHVARWDFLTHCLSRMVCAAYWFHPFVWAAWRRLRLEAERACDDAVLREGDARDYASLLVSIAHRETDDTGQPLLAMAGRDDLVARVAAVLDDRQARGRVGRRRSIGSIAAGFIVILGVAPLTVARALPQTQVAGAPSPLMTSEVATIKRNLAGSAKIRQADGRMTVTNATVRELLIFAYGVRDVDNAPRWIDFTRFDIVAKAPPRDLSPQGSKTLQTLLTERFKLLAHQGSKDFPIYALVLARPDGNLGPRLVPSQTNCAASKPVESSPCGLSSSAGRMVGRGITMAQLASHLPGHVGSQVSRQLLDRQVMDRTGLSGRFDFTAQWTPDAAVLTALEEQLGLRLDNQLAPEPVLVIDNIERPTEN